MELVGDFRSMDLILKGVTVTHSCTPVQNWAGSGSVGYTFPHIRVRSQHHWLLPARQPKATKQSPLRAVTPNPSVESPKAKHSGGKGGHHHSLRHSSNTSTLKCPDSTSAKKPSSSKEPASNKQEKSPRAHGSCKHGRSPSPSTKSVRCRQKEVHTEDTLTLNSTLPVSSSAFDSLCSPMGSHSYVTELLPPSITLTPLGLCGPRQW